MRDSAGRQQPPSPLAHIPIGVDLKLQEYPIDFGRCQGLVCQPQQPTVERANGAVPTRKAIHLLHGGGKTSNHFARAQTQQWLQDAMTVGQGAVLYSDTPVLFPAVH